VETTVEWVQNVEDAKWYLLEKAKTGTAELLAQIRRTPSEGGYDWEWEVEDAKGTEATLGRAIVACEAEVESRGWLHP